MGYWEVRLRIRKRLAAVAAATAAAAACWAPAQASAEPIEIGHIPECLEIVPAAIAAPPGQAMGLEVRVLLDGVSQSRGEAAMTVARQSYAPLNINLVPSYQNVSFTGTDAEGLIAQSKALFGGERPSGIDIVYTITNKDLEIGGDPAVAGLADCIGGVAFPANAFAVGENFTEDESAVFGVTLARNLTAKVAAHEVGHLMGGHHHYANCAEGLLAESLQSELSPCTLMFNAVDLASLNFSQVNGLVVRGHGEAYALP